MEEWVLPSCGLICRRKETGYAYFMPVWHLLSVLYHLLSTGWTLHYIIMYRVKTDYCWVPTPSVSQLLSCFGTQSGLSSNTAQQNCYLHVLQQVSFIYSDLSPHLSSSSLLLFFSFSFFFFFFFFFDFPKLHHLSCFSEGLLQNRGSFCSFGMLEQLWYSHIKLQIGNVKLGSNASRKQPASWPNKWISKKLSRLCEATIQVDATNNACTSRRRINQDDAVCSNITGVVFSHALKWSSLEQFLQWMSHCLSWMVYSELFLFSKNGGEILFSAVCEPSYLQVLCWCNTVFHSTVAPKL